MTPQGSSEFSCVLNQALGTFIQVRVFESIYRRRVQADDFVNQLRIETGYLNCCLATKAVSNETDSISERSQSCKGHILMHILSK